MSAQAEYKILSDYKLIVQCIVGDVYLKDFVNLKHRLVNDVDYTAGYSMIVDIRYANLKLSELDVEKYVSFLASESKVRGQGRSAILTSKPAQVALTTIFTQRVSHMPASWGIFSTEIGVLKWINKPVLSVEDFDKLVGGLKEKIVENR